MTTHQKWHQTSLATALLMMGGIALSGCGGGGSSSTADTTGGSANTLSGFVVDGPIEGARVFLDLNGNLEHDPGEPISLPTAADGGFTIALNALTQAQLTLAQLVTHVPSTARDADDGGLTLAQAQREPFTLMSPVSAFVDAAVPAFVSPLTTLVAAEMAFNQRSLAEARAVVREQLALGDRDPLTNFLATQDQHMAELARGIANELGNIGRDIADLAQSEGGQAVRDQVLSVIDTVRAELPTTFPELGDTVNSLPGPSETDPGEALDAFITLAAGTSSRVAGTRYVVVFKPTVGNPRAEGERLAKAHGGQMGFAYEHTIRGFSVTLPAQAVPGFLEGMSRNPNVDRVEPDIAMKAFLNTQSNATWGLDRSDQRDLPLSGSYSYALTGQGVRAYVVDTGIRASHTDFGDRVVSGYTVINDGNGTSDCNGHGTHVAGTLGGSRWGIAKGATLVPVRVLDCNGSGTLSGVIAGIDWAVGQNRKPAVINLSLGGGASSSLDAAVAKAVDAGYPVVAAAGNANANACNYSPAREPAAITVGATTSSDARASFSNFGSCLDLFAPGASITSAWYSTNTATATSSGTSMAAPHVAGLAALLLEAQPTASVVNISSAILDNTTTGKVSSAGSGSPNRLLFTLSEASAPVVDSVPVSTTNVSVASLTSSVAKLKNGWRASVTIVVRDAAGKTVPSAKVSGGFTSGGSSVACTTGSNGSCSVSTGTLSTRVASTTFSVSGITGDALSYHSADNAVSQVTVARP